MEVSCPNCYATYPINPEKLPEKGATPTCKKCGVAFTIVRATGDPIKDRAQRMKGYVLIRDGKREEELYREKLSASGESSRKGFSAKALVATRNFRRGAWVAGIVFLVGCAGFFVWKQQVHTRFEKALKTGFEQASNEQFAVAFEKVSFSWLGGLSRERGWIHGVSVQNLESRETLKLADKIHFELEPSNRRFVTKPFDVFADGKNAKTVLKGCVIDTREGDPSHLMFRTDEAYSIVSGIEAFTILDMEISFHFKTGNVEKNPSFVYGDGDFLLRAGEIHVRSEPVIRGADILFSLKNGVFPKSRPSGAQTPLNVMDLLGAQWAENQAVALLERCSLTIFGSPLRASGALEFQNPMEQSKAELTVSVSQFRPIMQYLHLVSEEAFDRVVVTLVALDEKNAGAYNRFTDALDLSLSYRDARVRVNNQDIQSLL